MAALRVRMAGDDRPEVSRLGHRTVRANVDTWRTFIYVGMSADGSAQVTATRDGERVHEWTIGAEPKDGNGEVSR